MTAKAETITYYTEWNTFTIWELSCYLYFPYPSFDLIIWWSNGVRRTREPNVCYSCWKSNYRIPQTETHRKISVTTHAKKKKKVHFFQLLLSPAVLPHSLAMSSNRCLFKLHWRTASWDWKWSPTSQAWPFTSGVRFPALVKAHTSQIPLWGPAQDVQVVEFH